MTQPRATYSQVACPECGAVEYSPCSRARTCSSREALDHLLGKLSAFEALSRMVNAAVAAAIEKGEPR